MNATVVELQTFGTQVALAELDLGSACEFLAWGSTPSSTATPECSPWTSEGGWPRAGDDEDDYGNVFLGELAGIKRGAFRGRGRSITFRLQVGGADLYGVGCVVMLDRDRPRFGGRRKPLP